MCQRAVQGTYFGRPTGWSSEVDISNWCCWFEWGRFVGCLLCAPAWVGRRTRGRAVALKPPDTYSVYLERAGAIGCPGLCAPSEKRQFRGPADGYAQPMGSCLTLVQLKSPHQPLYRWKALLISFHLVPRWPPTEHRPPSCHAKQTTWKLTDTWKLTGT